MDAYTAETREWLDRRYDRVDGDGVYIAHQPIYGFRAGHCEPWLLERYARTLAILRALSRLRFESCLDVGAAEGYKTALIRDLFGARVVASDLSESACERARQIYGLEAQAADVHDLPWADGGFDVVVCSETLEHVSDPTVALAELARVARVAVIVTVPNEPEVKVEDTRARHDPHGHINRFEPSTFDEPARALGMSVEYEPLVSTATRLVSGLVEGTPHDLRAGAERRNRFVRLYNAVAPRTSRLLGERAERVLLSLDGPLSRLSHRYEAHLFVLVKDAGARTAPTRPVRARDVVDFTVAPFRLPA